MFDLISIGNISIDLFFKGNSFTFKDGRFQLAVGGKYEADRFYQNIGGGGANVAIGAAKLGLKSAVWGTIGDNAFKRFILDELEDSKVSTRYVSLDKEVMNISTILLCPTGERSIIHYSPQGIGFRKIHTDKHELQKARTLFLANLPHASLEDKIKILSSLNERPGSNRIINMGIVDCRRATSEIAKLIQNADVIISNGHEFAELAKVKYEEISFHKNLVQLYLGRFSEKLFVVTEGKNGSFAYQAGKVYRVKSEPVDRVIDTTGAGDGYTAAFISEWHKNKDIEAAMQAGSSYASKILRKIGAN